VSGTHLDEVGVRLRGSGTWDEKPGFRLKLNEFVAGQRYAGVERVVLDAMTDDPAQGRIVLAAKLWGDAGILAPRVTYAQVYVNGELFGLYANIEAIDDHFLAHHYAGDDGGDLWEAGDSADLTGYGVDHFDLVSGDGDEQSLEAARRAVWSDDDFYAAADARIDMAQFLDVWAWSIVVGSADSYPYDLNDYDLYDDPADDRYDFAVPTFAGAWDSGMQWDSTRGALGYRCLADETCRAELLTHATTAFTAFDGLDSVTVASDLFTLTDTAIVDDPRRASTTTEVTTARTTLTSRLSSWPERVRGEMGI
jgi:spore coat protein CotH